jgi:hypothetical protein
LSWSTAARCSSSSRCNQTSRSMRCALRPLPSAPRRP